MTQTKTFLAHWRWAVAVGLLLLLALVLSGCGAEPTVVSEAASTEPPPTQVAAQPTTAPTELPPTEAPTDLPPTEPPPTEAPTEPPPTATPTEEPTPEVVDDSACIACHTDEETLKSLAKEPEKAESLSEGEG